MSTLNSLLGAELAAQKLNFPSQLGKLAAAAEPLAPPILAAVLEDDGGCAAEGNADALGALAGSMQRFLSASCAPPAWIPAVQLPAPLLHVTSAPNASTVVTKPVTLLHPPRAAVAAAARVALRQAASTDSGPGWFNMAAPALTPDLKRDLRLLRLRGAFDPKRFYKSADSGRLPEHFAVRRVLVKRISCLCALS
jgi:hypothetical protein